jgi:dihydropteroate synthase
MTKRLWWLVGIGTVFGLGVYALSVGSPLADDGKQTTSPGLAPASVAASVSVAAEPDKFIAVLASVDASLAESRDRAMNRGQDICNDINEGDTDAAVVESARLRYNGGGVKVSAQQAAQIVDAARQWLCV